MNNTPISELNTGRLSIRPLTKEDIPSIHNLMVDPEIASMAGFKPIGSIDEAEGIMRESTRSGSAYGITLKDAPWDVFGMVTLLPRKSISGDGVSSETIEIGYFMRKDMRGNGYMPEVMEAFKIYLFQFTSADKLIITLFPRNKASKRVAEKCGFSFDKLETDFGRNGATGVIEDLEFYSLSKEDFKSGKGLKGSYMIDAVVPGRVLSEGCPGIPVLKPFYEGKLCGLKDEEGNVVFEPVYDTVFQWPDADVIYALRGGEYGYYDTKGQRILTEVEPLDGVNDGSMPYYVSEEQGRPELMVFTQVDGPSDGRCCYMKGRWVRLGRILRSGVRSYLGEGNALAFEKDAFTDFQSPFTYIYAAFEAESHGDNDIVSCVESLRLMGCYDSSWAYLTQVSFSATAQHVAEHPASVFAAFHRYLSQEDLHRIAVSIDPKLPSGAIRVRQVRYFKDRWPLDEELDYRDKVVSGTFEEMVRARSVALTKIREVCRPELRAAAVKDFLSGTQFPGELYRSADMQECIIKMRQLFSFGYRKEDAVWQVLDCLRRDLQAPGRTFSLGSAVEIITWLAKEGADINHVHNLTTPMDILNSLVTEAEEHQSGEEHMNQLKNLVSLVKELNGKTVYDLCEEQRDDIKGILNVLYPWVK